MRMRCIDRCIWSLETAPINSLNFPRFCALLMLFFDLVVADPCMKICDVNCWSRCLWPLLQFHLGNCGNIYACYVTIVYFFQTTRITKWAFVFFMDSLSNERKFDPSRWFSFRNSYDPVGMYSVRMVIDDWLHFPNSVAAFFCKQTLAISFLCVHGVRELCNCFGISILQLVSVFVHFPANWWMVASRLEYGGQKHSSDWLHRFGIFSARTDKNWRLGRFGSFIDMVIWQMEQEKYDG